MLDGKRIFIEASPGIGDLIMISPILRKIKELYPTCKITVFSKESSLSIISRVQYIDYTCPMDLGVWPIIKAMKRQDYVIFFNYKPLLFALAKILGVKHRIGPCKEKNKYLGLCTKYFPYSEKIISTYQGDVFASHVCDALGIPLFQYDYHTDVSIPTEAEFKSISKKIKEIGKPLSQKYVCIAPFGNTSLDISDRIVLDVSDYIMKKYGYGIVFLGTKDTSLIKRLTQDYHNVFNLCGKTSLMEMVALLSKSTLMFCTDSGPMHVSCALGVKTVALFTTDRAERWAEKHNCYPVTLGLECSPCVIGKMNCGHKRCLNDIKSESIIETIDLALSKKDIYEDN